MTADIELLPLPGPNYKWITTREAEAIARANVTHHTAKLQAEIDALRADVKSLQTLRDVVIENHGYWKARAERLAEALREARDSGGYVRDVARAALRDHDQEARNG